MDYEILNYERIIKDLQDLKTGILDLLEEHESEPTKRRFNTIISRINIDISKYKMIYKGRLYEFNKTQKDN